MQARASRLHNRRSRQLANVGRPSGRHCSNGRRIQGISRRVTGRRRRGISPRGGHILSGSEGWEHEAKRS